MKNTKKILSALTLSGLACLFNDIAGWNPDALCTQNTSCRHLNGQEASFLNGLFGEHLQTDEVQIVNREIYGKALSLTGVNLAGFVLGKRIFVLNEMAKSDNYVAGTLQEQFFLAHEGTHIAQQADGMNLPFEVLKAYAANQSYQASYSFQFEDNKTFDQYGFEQQASIMGAYTYERTMADRMKNILDHTRPPANMNAQVATWQSDSAQIFKSYCKKIIQLENLILPKYGIRGYEICRTEMASIGTPSAP